MSITPTTAALTKLGLGENEAVLYEILLKTPDATIADLQRKSPFARTMLYYILSNLGTAGLVATAKKGSKTIYTAEAPEKLHDFIKDKEQDLTRQKASLTQLVTDLGSEYRLAHNKPGIRYFEGLAGIKEALDDSLTATEPICSFLDFDAVKKYASELDDAQYTARTKKHIVKRILVVDSPLSRATFQNVESQTTEVRFLPKTISIAHTTMYLYNQKIVYFTLRETDTLAVMISDPDLYAMQRNIFNFVWDSAQNKPLGPVAFKSE